MSPTFFAPDALRSYRLFESNDLDETRDLISRVMQPHVLVPSGKDRGHSYMDFVKLGRLGLGAISFGTSMHVDVESVDGYYLLMFCLRGHAEVRTLDATLAVDRNNAVLCAPGQPFDASLSPDCEQFVLRIDADAFRRASREAGALLSPRICIDSPPLQGWMQQLRALTGSSALLESARSNAHVAGHMEGLLIDLLACALPSEPRAALAQSSLAPAFVRRAEEFMRAHAGEPLQLEDIARAAGVSARTLRERFHIARGISPMQFLRDVRMQQAREALLAAGPRARIADIALACGFFHLGRFSIAYAKAFGESPSDTLRERTSG
ncbi:MULTISPECIES: anthranilate 1,2-dioxygenase regulatory protein AndR [unclassified Caballeronia]|uniref:anthranilate 1,2-dioxygenase regulatory protein AndR n=1 Tax=unclassified Caballeronia TaxID=2646786 RepID=UPI0028555F82|nr:MULTISPECIES: anthranilate 1,2-dioxygenase regulatory protein AndR [unclassified Caballeronia]MDR5741169.1 AraC family transcriptional regulator [Caballeronia sp. LZ016]MDR5807069.1 AraC family transcriptional regulator [Caballeronia sp. LZ019]